MKKRGSTHADWVVSLGIFLVYTLSLFLLIQPGVEPIFKNENLIKIVENSFVDNTRLVIEKTPIIFTPTTQMEIDPNELYSAEISGNIPIVAAVDSTFSQNDFSIRDSANNPLNFEMDILGNTITRIRVQADFSATDTTTLYLLYSPRASGQLIGVYGPQDVPTGIILSENGRPIVGEVPPESRFNFTRVFGSTEVLSGINSNIISISPGNPPTPPTVETVNFPDCADIDTYSALKGQWNYPSNKDFQIFVIPTTDPKYTLVQMTDVCNLVQPYEQANVFVQDRIDNTLDLDGNKEPLRISMRIW